MKTLLAFLAVLSVYAGLLLARKAVDTLAPLVPAFVQFSDSVKATSEKADAFHETFKSGVQAIKEFKIWRADGSSDRE